MSEKGRAAAREKVKRLTGGNKGSVDASGWTEAPAGFLDTDKKLGNRPISPQNLATGGKAAHRHGGRKSRDLGGATPVPANSAAIAMPPQSRFSFGAAAPSGLMANAGLKSGGRTGRKDGGGNWIAGATKNKGALHRELHVPEGEKIPAKKLSKAEHSSNPTERKRADLAKTLKKMHKADGGPVGMDPEISGTRPTGGRIARASGGESQQIIPREELEGGGLQRLMNNAEGDDDLDTIRRSLIHHGAAIPPSLQRHGGGRIARKSGGSAGKGKMNVNIIIAQKPDHSDMMPPPGAPTPMPRPPMPMPGPGAMPAPPPGGAPAGPMPGGPNMSPPSMARAAGGRTGMKYGAGSGMGRLEKIGKE
jgi:hypothetical protein